MSDFDDLNSQSLEDQHNENADELEAIQYPDEPRNKVRCGQEINITRKDLTIRDILVGVGWDVKKFDSNPLDLDVSVFLLDKNDKTRVDEDFIFYNNTHDKEGAVHHKGDSRTGAGDGDDEIISIKLNELSFEVVKICFVLSIYTFENVDHDFSMVRNVYFRLVNELNQNELFRFELDEELTEHDGLMIGYLERIGSEWIFQAVGETIEGGLPVIADEYGIVVAEKMQ